MVTIEAELRCPAPRPARLRPGARRRFAFALASFLCLGGIPVLHVSRQIWAFQKLQQDGLPVAAVVAARHETGAPGVRLRTLECLYSGASGRLQTALVRVSRSWWQSSPPGSRVTITTCEAFPGVAALGVPSDMQLTAELGWGGYGTLLLGVAVVLLFGARLRPFFRDLTLVSLGTPVTGRVVGKTWKKTRRLGRSVTLPLIHLHFRDPFGVERVRTQVVDSHTWAGVAEGETMTVLVCAHRRGWFAAYPLLLAEAAPLPGPARVTLGSERV
jgi:hypothetical protein